jgi:[acyl-carrier-protein] S-malonyltransferase
MATAFLFPGQGSQRVGMGKDVAGAYPAAREVFAQADNILGFALSRLCFDGPETELNDTINTQPALYVCSVALLRVLSAEAPAFVSGHSLGEFSALTAANALSFEAGLRLVRERGRLMKEAGDKQPGGMAALLGLDRPDVESLCQQVSADSGKPVVIANDNCPGQVVVSGDVDAVEQLMALATERGARKAVRLAVSIAAHSPLMASAALDFQQRLDETAFSQPDMPVYANATAAPMTTADEIRQQLARQLTAPVRWTETIQAMIAAGADRFVEIGAGDVLTGLVKRIDRKVVRVTINSVASLEGH